MTDKIFVITGEKELAPLAQRTFESEDMLQEILARYPDLLAGDQVDPEEPRRWLLVRREMGIAGEDDSADRWSLDHLFLDQDGIPTLIEVKRSTDTRIRREVIGQILDYAANAVVYWPVERIKASFEATCRECGKQPDLLLREFLQDTNCEDHDHFWSKVKTNLEAERVRLVLVADIIRPELRRIVEFLNGQMSRAEILALELKHYAGGNLRTLVPRVFGHTARADGQKSAPSGGGRQWDEASFMEDAKGDPQILAAAHRIIDWANSRAAGIRWGKGKGATFTARGIIDGANVELIRVFATGFVQFAFAALPTEHHCGQLRTLLKSISSIELSNARDYPGGNLQPLATEENWRRIAELYDRVLAHKHDNTESQASSPPATQTN